MGSWLGGISLVFILVQLLAWPGSLEAESLQDAIGKDCRKAIDRGLHGEECLESDTAIMNCLLRCISPTCYGHIYGDDPLEEGEKDNARRSKYKVCMRDPSSYNPTKPHPAQFRRDAQRKFRPW